ncbi:MAG TPA: DUF1326 domain-containing protein [Nitrososphaeraceae archaeon]|nr:DUF1326 domain-containing protein [Nitrososphaeraceae archaeon]
MKRLIKSNEKPFIFIFSGKAGGFMAEFAKIIGEIRESEYAQIKFEVTDELSYWSAEVPGKVVSRAEALTGPMTVAGKRVQTINAPGSEVGPGTVATRGRAVTGTTLAPPSLIPSFSSPFLSCPWIACR